MWTTTLSSGRRLTWRPATRADADLVWSWWNAPHVWFWSIGPRLSSVGTPPYTSTHVADYLERHETVLGSVDAGPPAVYAELYSVRDSPLATLGLVDPAARGAHVLIGDDSAPRPAGVEVVTALIDRQFADHPAAPQFVVDPDVRNTRARDLATRLGLTAVAQVSLPHKDVHVAAISRAEWCHARRAVTSHARDSNRTPSPVS